MTAAHGRLRRVRDMEDTAEELAALQDAPHLRWALETLGAELTGPFKRADQKALTQQRSYRRVTWLATTFGTLSMLLSITGLTADALDAATLARPILLAQSVTLLITATAVLRGLFAYRHENWLLERCRAEQLRARKFTHLLDPAYWSGDDEVRQGWAARVRVEAERAAALRYQDIESVATKEDVPALVSATFPNPASVDALAEYYDRKRLSPQRQYFLEAARDQGHFGSRALPLVFFGAVFLEILQVALMLFEGAPASVSITTAAILLSAASISLPAMWAGIRTYQGAREGSRNALRSLARHDALTQLSERLLAARGNPDEILWTMRLTEFILHVDQREWLRLLRGAEWYG